MCDYSLQHVQSRPAKLAEKLVTRNFGLGTRGFCSPGDPNTAVCVLPGTELAFDGYLEGYQTAIFRQVNPAVAYSHHDALELPNGKIIMLTGLAEGQTATVLQLPTAPKPNAEAEQQRQAVFAG
jgi:hypothetical protein